MTDVKPLSYANLVLPPSVVTKVDVSHLVSEVEVLDNALTAAAVRAKTKAPIPALPPLSAPLTEFLQQNRLNLNDNHQRGELITQMRLLKDKAPVINMTFAVAADRESLQQIAAWLRRSVHPQAVIAAGFQPGLVAGVYLRTPNHVFDMSMRGKLQGSHGLLVKELEALRGSR